MKKIISGIVGLVAVMGIVAGVGYTLFSDQVSLTGMVLATVTPGLEITLDSTGTGGWTDSLNVPDEAFVPLLPGEMDWGEFFLRNTSDGGDELHPDVDNLNMNLSAKLISYTGDWDDLKDAIQLRVCIYNDTTGYHCNETYATPWYTLATWHSYDIPLPGSPLLQGDENKEHYAVVFQIPESYGNEVSGKNLSDIQFTITGVQATD